MNGAWALIVPVVREDGVRAVLKLSPQFEEHIRSEPVALRAWNGDGAVRLLESDARSGSMLLERLDATSPLMDVADGLEALRILSQLMARLTAVPAPPGVRLLSDVGAELLERVRSALMRSLPASGRTLLVDCAAALEEVLPEPGDRLLHGDLHYDNILAPGPDDPREPWLAIDPAPIAGDPGFDLLSALHNRWDEAVATGDVPRAVRRRFDLMTDVLGLDRERAAAWTLARILQNMLWDIEHDDTVWHTEPDKAIALTLLECRG
jgi:streptomycin 6-kinase